jgi:ABC-type multidrug transport system fused ATPase/permease subunit
MKLVVRKKIFFFCRCKFFFFLSVEGEIVNAEFKYDPSAVDPILSNISLKIPNQSLTMVVGAVGSGKSTLALSILGEVPQTQGTRNFVGNVAYVSQEAWIINATLRENILFGEKYSKKKYLEVIEVAALG